MLVALTTPNYYLNQPLFVNCQPNAQEHTAMKCEPRYDELFITKINLKMSLQTLFGPL